ncbi:MAG: bifunctional demethylmenaquinone methyltransferase/2-methoxy-6-polyprenyl-1,4-benzoquinol methylase UbiE [Muribaculaceae bacterium]|nr:bifunctional demethylmenaquinone methyltransferase/2-methoxy-6-polyprenyl-1,4-benzoquinol methylase UbiE [Muribaculaceae bacterium]
MQKVENITPYGVTGDNRPKGAQVRDMFDSIAPAYDLMNRMMTLGIDKRWRRKCVDTVHKAGAVDILDLATGTADLAIRMAQLIPTSNITGVDLSPAMVDIGNKKVKETGLAGRVTLQTGDILNLPFADNSFDAVTIAFGVRNLEQLDKGYSEMLRVLRPGGTLVVLELTEPSSPLVRPLYRLYTRHVIPAAGRLVSHDGRAYTYLPESISAVPARQSMTHIMAAAGFVNAAYRNLVAGVAAIYTASKPSD